MKPASGGSAAEWHQDAGYGPVSNGGSFAVGLYLDDATLENGCMLMVPGSHKGPCLDHHEDGLFVGAIGASRGEVDFASAVPVQVGAGGVSIHGPFVVHGSSPNRSNRQRRLVLYGYQSSDQWRLFNGLNDDDLVNEFENRRKRLLRGELAVTIRFEQRLQRINFPKPEDKGSLFTIQRAQKDRYFK